MRYEHILRAVYAEPWLITGPAHAAIRALVEQHLLGQFAAERKPGVDMCGQEVAVDQMEVRDGVAIIPVGGVMARRLSGWERGAGAVDTLDVIADLDDAMKDPAVNAVILDIDSPGGTVNGTPELANKVLDSEKLVVAWTGSMAASAAYWLASAADRIFAGPSAEVGSIGVYIPWLDESAAYRQAGVNVEVISSGAYKGMGYPGTSLTLEQKVYLQKQVLDLAEDFKGFIRAQRPNVTDGVMQGQTFIGQRAVDAGLVDEIMPSLESVLAWVR